MKSLSAAALLLVFSLVPAVAEDTACVPAPTRVCVLGMAAEASEAAGKTLSTSNTDSEANERFTLVAGIKEAAGVNALYFVLSAGRGDITVPLVA